MKAMILAAGKGTRMRPMTLTTPKPMIPLVHKPVMQALIEHLRDSGVSDIVINTSYLPENIQNYFSDGSTLGVNIAYSFEGYVTDGDTVGRALGSAGGMKRIQEASQFFDDTFLVLCGDAFVDFDVKAMLDFHRENNSVATILMRDVPLEEVSKYGVVETSQSGQILQFQEKPTQEEAVSTMINTGIYMFEPSVLDHIPSDKEFDIGGELFPALVDEGEKFFGVCQDFQWIDIGTLPDFFECQELILKGEVDGFKMPGREIAPGIFVNIHTLIDLDKVEVSGPVYIGAGSCVLPGAVIEGPAVIGNNCIIEPGAQIKKSYIDSYKRVRSGAVIDELILHDKYAINRDGSYHDLVELKCEWMVDDARNIDPIGEFQEILADEARRVA